MSYSARMQKNHLYSVLLAPRGRIRMADAGAQIAQMYLSPFDLLIGVLGDAGSGKSMLIKGMFPGLELTNDDEGVNVRPLPLLDLDNTGFFEPHTYHMDVRFELGFHQPHVLATALKTAVEKGKRVIVEHFDLIYPMYGKNADLLIGVGEELIVTRPSFFGPHPEEIIEIVMKSVVYRRMAHTAEDLCEHCLASRNVYRYEHDDVRQGFILGFTEEPDFNIQSLEMEVREMIAQGLPVSFVDETHIAIGDVRHYCTGPRMHVDNTRDIQGFRLHPEFIRDSLTGKYLMVGIVGDRAEKLSELNQILL